LVLAQNDTVKNRNESQRFLNFVDVLKNLYFPLQQSRPC